MKLGYTDILVVVDCSGSMASIKTDTEGGFASFLEDQKKADGECTMNLYQFNTHYSIIYENMPVADAPALALHPSGGTALLDAIGRTVVARGEYYASLPEDDRPEHVVLVIMTDGEENSSREFTLDQIKSMLEHQQEVYGWQVIYLGANQDAISVAGNMGISAQTAMSYAASSKGVGSTYDSVSNSVLVLRSSGSSVSFSDTQRSASMGN